jgi:hypothetical protein
MTPYPVSASAPRLVHYAAVVLASLCMMGVSPLASAQTLVYAYSASCQGFLNPECFYGPTASWSPPNGAAANSSVSHGWSYITTGGDTSYNYAATAAAQASVSGVDKWSASSSASGYFNSPGTYTGNGVGSAGIIQVRDEFKPASTPAWNGPGWFRLTYRITGTASVNYAETSHVSGQTLGSAQSSITFECGSARVGGAGSSPCQSADFSSPSPGSINLIAHMNFEASQRVDRIVSFDMAVYSDQLYAYRLQTTVGSNLTMNALNRTGRVQGGSSADFSHTFSLVDAKLFDAGFNEVSQWAVTSASGFDYAHIAAVPEPSVSTLVALGAGILMWRSRRWALLSPESGTAFAPPHGTPRGPPCT